MFDKAILIAEGNKYVKGHIDGTEPSIEVAAFYPAYRCRGPDGSFVEGNLYAILASDGRLSRCIWPPWKMLRKRKIWKDEACNAVYDAVEQAVHRFFSEKCADASHHTRICAGDARYAVSLDVVSKRSVCEPFPISVALPKTLALPKGMSCRFPAVKGDEYTFTLKFEKE